MSDEYLCGPESSKYQLEYHADSYHFSMVQRRVQDVPDVPSSGSPEDQERVTGEEARDNQCNYCQSHGIQCEWNEHFMSCIPCHQADQGCSKTISQRPWHWAQTITHLIEEAREPQSHSEYLPHRIFETGNNEDLDHN